MKLDVLAFAAHRDDTEITCGGTLIRMVEMGYKVGAVDLTAGEMGTRGDERDRAREAAAATRVMGLALRLCLGLPDAAVESTRANKMKIVRILRKYQPHTVIIPHTKQRHPDHAVTPRLVYDACFLAGLKKIKAPGAPHRPFKILQCMSNYAFTPSFVVDITKQMDRKIEAIRCYESQFGPQKKPLPIFFPTGDIFGRIRMRNSYYGSLIGTDYGEPFFMRETHAINDIVKMPVKSI